jgi:hypothetical protein
MTCPRCGEDDIGGPVCSCGAGPARGRTEDEESKARRRIAGMRQRFRRNLVIYVAHKQGVSGRLLADVFGLQVEQVEAIVARWRENYGETPVETLAR